MIGRDLSLLDIGVFSRDMLTPLCNQIYGGNNCVVVLRKNIYLERLISGARANKCYVYCNGSIFRLVVGGRINIEYWSGSGSIRIYGFKLRVWDNQRIFNSILLIIESSGESYVSGIYEGEYIESYVDRNEIVLVLSRNGEKLLWECIG